MFGTDMEMKCINTQNIGSPPVNSLVGMPTNRACSIHVPSRDFTAALININLTGQFSLRTNFKVPTGLVLGFSHFNSSTIATCVKKTIGTRSSNPLPPVPLAFFISM